ncbi:MULTISPECIES: GNAT family N-acetyltransferase [unclassified Paenibacillus]|uniref:GNAT family N-acetyltransferase n=1 Tax=unclassified Paenibacillus TaxID=185978 RepID=UPI0008BDF0B7|nr:MULTISPECIES: GNAT family N-acetyltransferase [unclassified Paenibacillus]QLG37247.1 GNAT family N-acetyltransferase [Paenibacillus sp. E222]SEO94904.1 Acetyltransferase (GNAT) family protein [Paenibacillus sp. OK076]
MSEINIRRAVIGDYKGVSALMDELHRLHVEARPDVYRELQPRMSHKEYEQLLETDHRHLYVAELLEQGEIVGYASAQLNVIQNVTLLNDRRMLYINEIIVGSKHRGHGTGKLLMQVLIELGKEIQVDSVELTVSTFNTGAQAFYEQLGLSVRSSRMEYIL